MDLDQSNLATLLAQQRANDARELAERQRREAQLAAQREAQQLAQFDQQLQQQITELSGAMGNQISTALSVWNQFPQANLVQGEWASKQYESTAGVGGQTQLAANGSMPAEEPSVILKAGTILFAVIDTAINSDETRPGIGHHSQWTAQRLKINRQLYG